MVLWVILRASNMSGGGVICPFPCCPTTGGFYGSHLNSQNLLNIFPNFADVWSGFFFKVFVRFRADRWSVGFRADTFERDWRDKESTNKPADDKNVSINHNGPRDWVTCLWFVQNFVNPQFDHHTFSSKFGEKRSLLELVAYCIRKWYPLHTKRPCCKDGIFNKQERPQEIIP